MQEKRDPSVVLMFFGIYKLHTSEVTECVVLSGQDWLWSGVDTGDFQHGGPYGVSKHCTTTPVYLQELEALTRPCGAKEA